MSYSCLVRKISYNLLPLTMQISSFCLLRLLSPDVLLYNCTRIRCDRILWKGEGLKQMWYVRGESRFSDHRPVHSLFSVQVILSHSNTSQKARRCSTSSVLQSACAAKVQAEELLIIPREQSCIDTTPRL